MSRWFRFYDEVLNDRKVQKLSPDLFKGWVNLLCLASAGDGEIGTVDDVAFSLRMSDDDATELVAQLVRADLIELTETGMRPHAWDKRQFKSDVSTDRVKRFRETKRNVSETVDETSPEQSRTETDTDTKQSFAPPDAAPARERKSRKKPNVTWPDAFKADREYMRQYGFSDADFAREYERFKNHAKSTDRRCADWDAAWRNWVLKAAEFAGKSRKSDANTSVEVFQVWPGTPEWKAWMEFLRTSPKNRFAYSAMVETENIGIDKAHAFSTRWPPDHEAAKEPAEPQQEHAA